MRSSSRAGASRTTRSGARTSATAACSARTSARQRRRRRIKESTLGLRAAAFLTQGAARFAVVNAGGQQVRGAAAPPRRLARRRAATRSIFDADVRGCAYYATLGDPTAAAPPDERADHGELTGVERERSGRPHDEGERQRRRQPAVPPTRPLLSRSSVREAILDAAEHLRGCSRRDRERRDVRVTTLLAPITQRSPTVTPLVITTFAPHQTLSPTRVGPLLMKPCQVIGWSGSSKRWLRVGDEAAVGEHAVIADLDEVLRGDHHPDVEERPCADPDARLVRAR